MTAFFAATCPLAKGLVDNVDDAGVWTPPSGAKIQLFKGNFKLTTAFKFAADFADAAIKSLTERFFNGDPSLEILSCFSIFDPSQYIGMGIEQLADFGNAQWQQLKDFFWPKGVDAPPNSPFSERGAAFMAKLDDEFMRIKVLIQARVALLPSTTMQQLWIFIAVSDDCFVVPNILMLMNLYYVIAMHTSEVERGFSIHRILKSRLRNRLMILMVDSLLRIYMLAASFTSPKESGNNKLISEAAELLSGASLKAKGATPPSLLKRLVEEVSKVQVSFLDCDLDEAAEVLMAEEGMEDVNLAVALDDEGGVIEEEEGEDAPELESDEDDFPLIDLMNR
jgi:hypothetical protein